MDTAAVHRRAYIPLPRPSRRAAAKRTGPLWGHTGLIVEDDDRCPLIEG
ncbi:MAG: hypothetical protein O3B05_04730 [archaeon]|nr:hypothetical protein [archaeon]